MAENEESQSAIPDHIGGPKTPGFSGPIPDHIGGPKTPALSPQLLNFGTLKKGSKGTAQMVIANMNTNSTMNWSADVGGATWLSLASSSGSIPPGQQQVVTVMADTSTLSLGNHSATLTINSNEGTTALPASVTVN